jgi:hypothetical protein
MAQSNTETPVRFPEVLDDPDALAALYADCAYNCTRRSAFFQRFTRPGRLNLLAASALLTSMCARSTQLRRNNTFVAVSTRIEVAADDVLDPDRLRGLRNVLNRQWTGNDEWPLIIALAVNALLFRPTDPTGMLGTLCRAIETVSDDTRSLLPEAVAFSGRLLADVFCTPWDFAAEWRTAATVDLATGIYRDKAFDRMPVLADALEEAGCAGGKGEARLLADMRTPGRFWCRGCLILDQLLGKR